jgi:nitrogen fixation/metabolism regulation signal transduction histidine kinase
MAPVEVSLKRPRLSVAILAIVTGLTGLGFLIQAVEDSPVFGPWHNAILAANTIVAIALLALIMGNVWGLFRELRRRAPGARLKLRLLIFFSVLSTVPVGIVYTTAVVFLHRGIESWIDERVAGGLRQARELSVAALNAAQRVDLERTQQIGRGLGTVAPEQMIAALPSLRRQSGAEEVTVFDHDYRILATSSDGVGSAVPRLPRPADLMGLSRSGTFVSLEGPTDGVLRVRTAVSIEKSAAAGGPLVVTALFPLSSELRALADSVQTTYRRYGELIFLRGPIEFSFTLSLSVVVLLTLLGAAYLALLFAWQLVTPIEGLVEGTRAVAGGDLDTRLPVKTQDDIGALVASFNEMTSRLRSARDDARHSAAEVETARANLAAVLARLTTGVIVIDPDRKLRLANEAAGSIVNADLGGSAGMSIDSVALQFPTLGKLLEASDELTAKMPGGWREQIILATDNSRRVLMCAATPLPEERGSKAGYVLVFDEITALLQAQRDAAWGEVARRLAHEIKNPLTPIQLSAERIRRRVLGSVAPAEAEVVDRATHTIVQQVEAMRDMVNAFSDYARVPEVSMAMFDLNSLVREVAELYQTTPRPEVRLALDPALPLIEADRGRLRQLLHNLIRNACEALEDRADGWVQVSTASCERQGGDVAEIRVEDNGPGFAPELLDRVFEPYVTGKSRGTGLGLAIVRRLVEEHGGSVAAENRAEGGAVVTVTLPFTQESRVRELDPRARRAGDRR